MYHTIYFKSTGSQRSQKVVIFVSDCLSVQCTRVGKSIPKRVRQTLCPKGSCPETAHPSTRAMVTCVPVARNHE